MPDTSRDEVGELARAFNRMAADLETADRDRRELIANVSHELRTPISALHAILENLVDGVAAPDPATLQVALAQTERLGRLVRELLDLARIDAGTEPLDRQDVPVAQVLEAAVAEASMAGRDVRFAVDVSPPQAVAWADGARLHQVLANLLDNAARHSPPGGTVQVTARSGPHGLHLEVADDGPGYRTGRPGPGLRPLLPRRAGAAGGGGTGLGLAIARWAVALHGGRIGLADETGSRFIVDLPGRPEEAA